jgi:DNA adenine methylase
MSKSTDKKEETTLGPALKWAGGKRWLIPRILELYQKAESPRLIEPFVGGMAVALGLMPAKAHLNDINPHLINFYDQLKEGLLIETEMLNDKEFFYKQRELFNELIQKLESNHKERAILFYYLNRSCFNGLCRFNNSGLFNVPFGQYSTINYMRDFSGYKKLLKNWKFSCGDFEEIEILAGDFIYVDPPYDVEFTKYSKEDFNWDSQQRLVKWLSRYNNPIVASNQATPRILALYKEAGFVVEEISAPRRISSNGNRDRVLEMFAYKNL